MIEIWPTADYLNVVPFLPLSTMQILLLIWVTIHKCVRFLENLHEHNPLYDIMLWNKSLIMDFDVLLVKIAYLSYL